jgi:hypothetical protein
VSVYADLRKPALHIVERTIRRRIVSDKDLIIQIAAGLNARPNRPGERLTLIVGSNNDARPHKTVLLSYRIRTQFSKHDGNVSITVDAIGELADRIEWPPLPDTDKITERV